VWLALQMECWGRETDLTTDLNSDLSSDLSLDRLKEAFLDHGYEVLKTTKKMWMMRWWQR